MRASVPAAVLGSFVQGGSYVACLYINAGYRRSGGRAPDRDDIRVIKQRFARVGIASILAPLFALLAASAPGGRESCVSPECDASLARWLGLWAPGAALALVLPLALTMVLFLGPLTMAWLERDRATSIGAAVLSIDDVAAA